MIYDIARLFQRLEPKKRLLLVALCVFTSFASALEILGILLVFPLIRLLYDPGFIHQVSVLQQGYVRLGFSAERYFILAFGGLVLGVFCIKNLYITSVYLLQRRIARRETIELSRLIQRQYLTAPYLHLLRRNTAELIRNVRQVVPQVYLKVALSVVNLVAEVFVVLGIAILLLWIEPLAIVAVAAVVGILFGIQYYIFAPKQHRWGVQTHGVSKESYKKLNEAFRAVKEIRVLGREQHFLNNLGNIHDQDIKLSSNRQFLYELIRPTSEIVMLSGIFLVMAIVLLSRGPMESLPSLGIFALAGIRLLPTLNRLFHCFGEIRNGIPATRRILSELDSMKTVNGQQSSNRRLAFKHSIQIEKLKFRYPKSGRAALFPTDAVIHRGEFVGIFGPSGAGKSTLMDLILCLLTPMSGRLLIDGQCISADPRPWQNNIGYVPQSIYFIDDTLRRNVALGISDASIDDARIWEVLHLASLDDVVAELPAGLDSSLGEDGINFSGGQRQRIGIARALYHNPEVLVLDEATADLDYETEYAVTQTLRDLRGKKTIIMIAHRLTVVKECDMLFFMNNGRIVDRGTIDELYERNSHFRHLADLGHTTGPATAEFDSAPVA